MELMEKLYKDDNIRVHGKLIEERMENHNQTNKLLLGKILCEFHICLDCKYTLRRGHCSTCAPIKLTLLEIMNRYKVWLNVVIGFFMLPFGNMCHLTLTNSVPTWWSTGVPIYCPHVGKHVLIVDTHLFDNLELFCRDRIKNINALEIFLCFSMRIFLC